MDRQLPPSDRLLGDHAERRRDAQHRSRGRADGDHARRLARAALDERHHLRRTTRTRSSSLNGGKVDDPGNLWFIGQPINNPNGGDNKVWHDYEFAGIWQTSEAAQAAKFGRKPGEIKIVDLNGDGKFSTNDKAHPRQHVSDVDGQLQLARRLSRLRPVGAGDHAARLHDPQRPAFAAPRSPAATTARRRTSGRRTTRARRRRARTRTPRIRSSAMRAATRTARSSASATSRVGAHDSRSASSSASARSRCASTSRRRIRGCSRTPARRCSTPRVRPATVFPAYRTLLIGGSFGF